MSVNTVCPACQRRIFSNGGHQSGCRLDIPSGLRQSYPGFIDDDQDQRFVNAWDEATYYNDDSEGDRQ